MTTIIEVLNEQPNTAEIIQQIEEDGRGEEMLLHKRENLIDSMTVTGLEEHEVRGHLLDREEDFLEAVEEDAEPLPEWLLRMEALDLMANYIHDEFEKEGIIDD